MQLRDEVLETHVFSQQKHHGDDARSARVNRPNDEVRCKYCLVQPWHGRHCEVPRNDTVHRHGKRDYQDRQKRIGPAEAVPFPIRSTPAEGQQHIHVMSPAFRAVPDRREVRYRSHVNKDHAPRHVRRYCHHVKHQR